MCLAIPGKVVKVEGRKATIEYPKEIRTAFVSDVPIEVGDTVLVQMGIIVKTLSSTEAKVSYKAWEDMGPL